MNATNEDDPGQPRIPGDETSSTSSDGTQVRARGSILRGVWLASACNVAVIVGALGLTALTEGTAVVGLWLAGISLTQFVHLAPLASWLNARGEHRSTKGVWIVAGITALLNAACFGIVVSSL